jgi:hypothetical protein
MAWFKVDDGFYSSRKVIRIPRNRRASAIGIWLLAGTWCADKMTDGAISVHEFDELGGASNDAQSLLDCGLWERADDGGYQFHNWEKYQPVRAKILSEQEAAAKRQKEWRARNGDVTLPRPDPTRPDPTPPTEQQFAEFWSAYPRKVGKPVAKAKFVKALGNGHSFESIMTGVKRWAESWDDPQFIPHPSTFLFREQFMDTPATKRSKQQPMDKVRDVIEIGQRLQAQKDGGQHELS